MLLTQIEYSIADIDEHGDLIDYYYWFDGKGSKAKALKFFETYESDLGCAAVLERVTNKISRIDNNPAYDELKDRDYETIAHKGCEEAFQKWHRS